MSVGSLGNKQGNKMKFSDYSPPASPPLDQQRDALRKGLGRAMQWAARGRLDDEPLLEACLHDQRFDWQVEDSRGDWLWDMVQAVGAVERFRVPILHALYDLSDERSAMQLCELARCYAKQGDEAFRSQLYKIVEKKPFDYTPWVGEEEVIGLDGEQGFLFAARVRGRLLANREWEYDDENPIRIAVERFGEECVNGLLEESSDAAISRFREGWRREKQKKAERASPQSQRERMTVIPVEEVVRAAEGENKCFWFRVWGMYAKETDLQTVLQTLWAAREPSIIANLLKVFSRRALPEFDARLLELCRHDNEEVRRWAFGALEENKHSLVREFALTELGKGVHDGSVVALLINNYLRGDEHLILESMEFPEDECELHWLFSHVINVLENNPHADCFPLGVITYTSTPCGNCRFKAARLLHNQQVAPTWLSEECRYDSCKDSRELIEKPAESSETG
jgi:hypothetical protein